MYDWANSAYVTTVVAGLLQSYFARAIVGAEGVKVGNSIVSATSLWGYMIGFAAFLSFLFAPVLGAISDFSSAKKKFLLFFAYTGSLFTVLLYFSQAGDVWTTVIIFIITQVGYVGANVFYDAFLPQIASESKLDRVSAKGFSFGYIGGGLQFAIALGMVAGHKVIGIDQALAARIGISMAGLWWGGFTLFTLKFLKESEAREAIPEKRRSKPLILAYIAIGLERTLKTARKVRQFKHLLLFLIAFMIYNDGIQTVIGMASIYGTEELKLSRYGVDDHAAGHSGYRCVWRSSVRLARGQDWNEASRDAIASPLERRCHLRLFSAFRDRVFCVGNHRRRRSRRLTSVESLSVRFHGTRGSERRVLRLLLRICKVFRDLGTSRICYHSTGDRNRAALHHFSNALFYRGAHSIEFRE